MTYIDSNKFSIKVNRNDTPIELGENGRVQSTVYVYKGDVQLIPVETIPNENQFRVTISSTENCSASIKDLNTIYVNYIMANADEGSITLDINVEGKTNFIKRIKLIKSVTRESVSNIEKRVNIAEQRITDDAITNMVKKEFYTKSETNTKMSLVEQSVDSWGVRIVENEKTISELKLTNEEFEVTIGNKADSSNIISMINASSEGIKIQGSKVNITGFVTFTDLSSAGATTISGSNITTGTIDASKANITNINASNIKTGTLSGDYIYGGILKGVLLQTYADDTSKGVSIGKDSLGLNGTYLSYYTSDEFRMSSPQRIAISSANDIYLMAGLVSGSTQTDVNNVVIPNATLRTQRLNVVEGANFQSTVAVSSSVSCNSLNSVGSVTGNNVTINTGSVYLGTKGATVTASYVKMGTGGYMAAYSGFHFVQSNGTAHNVYAGTFYSNGSVITSDRKKKKDIKYVNKDKQTNENGIVSPNVNITKGDMHEFVETLPLASFRYIDEFESGKDKTHYGVITQDILYTKVGSELVEVIDEDETTGIAQDKFIMFLCGALQEEIKVRKELEERVINLENKLNNSNK